ncbi:MAG TPA: prolyl oligopeptidase family serine peptidase, partial [Lysobacter sp.]
ILNTPELDPEAYRISSPIEHAAGLQDHLLIAHGMIDDNVFFKDSVMLAQKLIELRKDKWSIAPYPLERHGFVHPDAWYDEYRRIRELFKDALGQ